MLQIKGFQRQTSNAKMYNLSDPSWQPPAGESQVVLGYIVIVKILDFDFLTVGNWRIGKRMRWRLIYFATYFVTSSSTSKNDTLVVLTTYLELYVTGNFVVPQASTLTNMVTKAQKWQT
jgi:hypothetical protein